MPFAVRQTLSGVAFRAIGKSLKPPSGWIPLAQVEDPDDSAYPAEEQLWPSRMRTMVENFDAIRFRPPVIRPYGGPSHYTGEHGDPCGFVTTLDFDGVTLWGKLTEISDWGDGRIKSCVADGYWGRSIGFWFAYNGEKDNFKLRHLALLGGEPEGQADLGLPPLTRFFKSAYAGTEGGSTYMQEATRAASEPFASRVYGRSLVTPPNQEDAMDQKEMDRLFDGVAARASKAVGDALAPVEQRLTELQGTITAQAEELKATRAAADAATAAAAAAVTEQQAQGKRTREQGFRSRLETAKSSARVAEGEIDELVGDLMALPDDRAEAAIKRIEARTPMLSDAARTILSPQGDGTSLRFTVPASVDLQTAEAFCRTKLPENANASQAAAAFARAGMVDPATGFLN